MVTEERKTIEIIAIDGLAGTGKSTLANRLSERLGISHLDTGASFRMAALVVLQNGIDPDRDDKMIQAVNQVEMSFENGVSYINGLDVSGEIRSEQVSSMASRIAVSSGLRLALLKWQRAWVDKHGASVVEGRDIGSVVFPDALVKVYLYADDIVRSRRRTESSEAGLRERDQRDLNRRAAPTVQVKDAVVIDTTLLGPEKVEELVAQLWMVRRSTRD